MPKFMVEIDIPVTMLRGSHLARYATESEVFKTLTAALENSDDPLFAKASVLEIHNVRNSI